MTKKIVLTIVLSLLLAMPVYAATTDFTADGNITVESVIGTNVTANLLIMSGSTAQSWTISGGAMTVTNPGTFNIGSSNTNVGSIRGTATGSDKCANNSTPGSSYLTLPSDGLVYTITPQNGVCSTGGGVSAGSSGGGGGTPTTTTEETPTPSTTTTPVTTPSTTTTTTDARVLQNQQIASDANAVATFIVDNILANVGATRNTATESSTASKYTNSLVTGLTIGADAKTTLTNFIAYGTASTKILGAGERAGVVNSYKAAFGKLPATESQWSDVIKIANGRWPSEKSTTVENNAAVAFKKIYLRSPNRTKNANDDAAVTVIAYGLRPSDRNLNSEKAAIKSFKAIYGYAPSSATAWDIVRAIAYSGAKR